MRFLSRLFPALLVPLALTVFVAAEPDSPKPIANPSDDTPVTWKKTHVDPVFHSEGVAVADVNKDGKLDILVGDLWYEAPNWTPHEIRPVGKFGDGAHGYSQSFACWADDINGDGWADLIVIGFPGAPCHWYENPQNKSGHWKQHVIWHSACNETPIYADLLGTGKKVLVMAWQPPGKEHEGRMAYFAPGADPTALWEMHPVSEPSSPGREIPGTFKYSHGLGVGDVNGDGKADVIVPQGWWEQPKALDGTPWTYHPANLGEACADMHVYDMPAAGEKLLFSVISSSAHGYGIWEHRPRLTKDGARLFSKNELFPRLVSQTHALNVADINGDGLPDLITGKRWWAHGPTGDVDAMKPAMLYWFEAKRPSTGGLVTFTPHVIDDASGIGTQFVVTDVNRDGFLDIVVSNKRGVFLFEQGRSKPAAGR